MPNPLLGSPWPKQNITSWPTHVPTLPLPGRQSTLPISPVRPMGPPSLGGARGQLSPLPPRGVGPMGPQGPGGPPQPFGGGDLPTPTPHQTTFEEYTSRNPDLSQYYGEQPGLPTGQYDKYGNPIMSPSSFGLDPNYMFNRSQFLGEKLQQSQDDLAWLSFQRESASVALDDAIKAGNLADMTRRHREVREIENLHAQTTFQNQMLTIIHSILGQPGIYGPAVQAMGGFQGVFGGMQAPQLGMEDFQAPGIPHVLGGAPNEEGTPGMSALMGGGGPLANNPEAVQRSMTPGAYGTGQGGLPALGGAGRTTDYSQLGELLGRVGPYAALIDRQQPNTNRVLTRR